MITYPEHPIEFINLVRKMRYAQNAYFRTKDKTTLKYAKELERQVDHSITYLTMFKNDKPHKSC